MDEIESYIKKIGKNIVKLREERNLKQIDLSIKLNIEDSALRRIETGRTNPTIKTLYNIAVELNVDLIELLRND
ncbi:MAG: XRE family transcriptional regulator [Bacteroidetes bacterium HGW-Bacteroidetes-2]|jgi:transcriptional regulator with XRE-family HTH domain|nr:helix-turn-helix transcriptional regulator [Flavobacteriia bacterium]OIP49588.1 MAG: hypothetical protein AUK33_10190 [Flavobacteriaceae bacterium CG2_30_34_30]PIQ18560.1 MAG: transcriptional regulator [Flavobacteriaceae bacterium CG18_big_fil_WC_8_21_14_2_50_34_36]PIV49014.1 MAG: XRE family transcriptional regulator [Flavobacteriaceae bacterium CG02_land_8_20_14_3_00_34_13]PIX09086.1 MAG: XRE family transcriptional regulator [Flavobacteriaceae bacterium CG_4_8_14_3_um_filter_34_10]PIZ07802